MVIRTRDLWYIPTKPALILKINEFHLFSNVGAGIDAARCARKNKRLSTISWKTAEHNGRTPSDTKDHTRGIRNFNWKLRCTEREKKVYVRQKSHRKQEGRPRVFSNFIFLWQLLRDMCFAWEAMGVRLINTVDDYSKYKRSKSKTLRVFSGSFKNIHKCFLSLLGAFPPGDPHLAM